MAFTPTAHAATSSLDPTASMRANAGCAITNPAAAQLAWSDGYGLLSTDFPAVNHSFAPSHGQLHLTHAPIESPGFCVSTDIVRLNHSSDDALASLLLPAGVGYEPQDSVSNATGDMSEVGRGASGAVRRVWDARLSTFVAEKRVLLRDPERVNAAGRELDFARRVAAHVASVKAALEDPSATVAGLRYIVSPFRAVRTSEVLVLTMDFVPGGSAATTLAAEGPLSIAAIRRVAKSLLHGLDFLHRQMGILHRDLKPANVLFDADERVRICDFGCCSALVEAADQVGTILQMAPERLRGEAHGPASDIWSFGLTVAELAIGSHPFASATTDGSESSKDRFWALAELIKHTADDEECEAAIRTVMARHLHTLPADLQDFVHACTVAAPSERSTVAVLTLHPFLNDNTVDDDELVPMSPSSTAAPSESLTTSKTRTQKSVS
jgi:serine/threonine protein kinase